MSEMIAYCGYRCDKCDTFIATRNDDNAMRQKIADDWTKKFSMDFQAEQMNCVGCLSDKGPFFFYCDMCEIRSCAQEKSVLTCAHCDDYGCEKLEQFLQMSPENREILENIRKSL